MFTLHSLSIYSIQIFFPFSIYLEDLDSDPAVMERNIKRLKDEQSKSRGQDGGVLQNLLSVTFSARHQQLVAVSDGKSRVSKFLKDWPILGQEIYVCSCNIISVVYKVLDKQLYSITTGFLKITV